MRMRDRFFLQQVGWLSILVYGQMILIRGLLLFGVDVYWASTAAIALSVLVLFIGRGPVLSAALAANIGAHYPMGGTDIWHAAAGAAFLSALAYFIGKNDVPFLSQRRRLPIVAFFALSPIVAGATMLILAEGHAAYALLLSLVAFGGLTVLAVRLDREFE